MTSLEKLVNILYIYKTCCIFYVFMKILFSLFSMSMSLLFMKDMAFTLPLLLALIVIPNIKKNIK